MSGFEFTYGGQSGELAARLRRLDEAGHSYSALKGRSIVECEIVTKPSVDTRRQARRVCLTHPGESWPMPRGYLTPSEGNQADLFEERVEGLVRDVRRDLRTLAMTGVNEHMAYVVAFGALQAILTPREWNDTPIRRLNQAAAVLDALMVASAAGYAEREATRDA